MSKLCSFKLLTKNVFKIDPMFSCSTKFVGVTF